jgi:plastocyanin
VGHDGTNSFYDVASGTTNTTIVVGRTVQWNFVSGYHSTTSGSCTTGCTPDLLWNSGNHNAPYVYTFTFNQVGTYPYYCMQHGAMMTGAVNVLPPGSIREPRKR